MMGSLSRKNFHYNLPTESHKAEIDRLFGCLVKQPQKSLTPHGRVLRDHLREKEEGT